MITALVSTVLGMIGGLLPEIMKEVRDTRNSSRERDFLRLQSELQLAQLKAGADARLREIDSNIMVEEAKAFREHLAAILESQNKPTGIPWVDAFNAVLRPTCVTLIMILFVIVAVPFTLAVISQAWNGVVPWADAVTFIFGSMVGESFMAVFGYLFGYRSTMKRVAPA